MGNNTTLLPQPHCKDLASHACETQQAVTRSGTWSRARSAAAERVPQRVTRSSPLRGKDLVTRCGTRSAAPVCGAAWPGPQCCVPERGTESSPLTEVTAERRRTPAVFWNSRCVAPVLGLRKERYSRGFVLPKSCCSPKVVLVCGARWCCSPKLPKWCCCLMLSS